LPYTLSIDQNNPDITWLIIPRDYVKNKARKWLGGAQADLNAIAGTPLLVSIDIGKYHKNRLTF
jgi:hypothetical protein